LSQAFGVDPDPTRGFINKKHACAFTLAFGGLPFAVETGAKFWQFSTTNKQNPSTLYPG
jgi:hypothetical protein